MTNGMVVLFRANGTLQYGGMGRVNPRVNTAPGHVMAAGDDGLQHTGGWQMHWAICLRAWLHLSPER